jgi:hypothetical protein
LSNASQNFFSCSFMLFVVQKAALSYSVSLMPYDFSCFCFGGGVQYQSISFCI